MTAKGLGVRCCSTFLVLFLFFLLRRLDDGVHPGSHLGNVSIHRLKIPLLRGNADVVESGLHHQTLGLGVWTDKTKDVL